MPLNNVYIIEGMDMVGKNTFVEENLPGYKLYQCRHDLTDQTVGRDNSWTIGYGVVDFLEQLGVCKDSKLKNGVVINRGVFSSYVYARLYNNTYLDKKVLDWYKNNEFFKETIGHIYIRHFSPETAQVIFEKSRLRAQDSNEISRKYDKFNTFNDYWYVYNMADRLFKEAYDYVGVKPRIFETLPDMTWKEVEG